MLEETADQFLGREILVSPLAGLAGAVRPAHLAVRQKVQAAIAGGGFEDVASQITERILPGTGGFDVEVPGLGPESGRDLGVEFRSLFFKFLSEERAEAVGQRTKRQEELWAGTDPGALVPGESAAGNQVMNVRMKD